MKAQKKELLAAAPELLEALKAIRDYCEHPSLTNGVALETTCGEIARSAIAKATGGK